jgi:phospholipase C
MNTSQSVTATFSKAPPVTLSVTVAGGGTGTVTSAPAGINCPAACSALFGQGTMVTLTATVTHGGFGGWSGACSGMALTCNVTMSAAEAVTATFNPPGLTSINHIIFMLQENRSFDHYLGHLNDYRHNVFGLGINDVDGFPYGQPDFYSNPSYDDTSTVQSFHLATQCVENNSPFWDEAHVNYNRFDPTSTTAKLNGFVFAAGKFSRDSGGPPMGFTDINGLRAMGYYTDADLPYYYYMATQFATSDRWFSPVLSNTEPNRMYLIAATSQGNVGAPPIGTKLTAKTIFQLLDENNITWKIYVPDPPPGRTILQDTYLQLFTYWFSPSAQKNIVPIEQYMTDVANGTLPQVAMIEGGYFTNLDEHPDDNPLQPGSGVQKGSRFVSTVINALMFSPSWKDSVFILSHDEDGAFFDLVPPQQAMPPDDIPPQLTAGPPPNICFGQPPTGTCGFNFTGFRVPFVVISPFSIPHFVSHTPRDHTAILKFIETRFNLPSLTARDAAQPDMLEFFNFANPPWATPPPQNHIPVQPNTELCDDSHLQ